ncbi:phosphoenolpyruvate--protein phosphotransferase [Protaetiibacter larvae]|uniref:Phosphoenolpyruvate-protein phosphotransferase n=1 Tax=Protaetiibacter larvae TaxID=2592654 RepID=A0A5C1YA96_9MICO|nr:phosphoenolpyruvate--protein phosphotransferase [Protaetiibacter larvae]QEO10766.1 phosphoenolpyruvate--protein phosphotransferase [Protaetiibacter larvae]
MGEWRGAGIGAGIAIGPVVRLEQSAAPTPTDTLSTLGAEAEAERVVVALGSVAALLRRRAVHADRVVRGVLEAQALMVEDPALRDAIQLRLDDGVTAEAAIAGAFGAFAELLVAAGGYVAERATDLRDLADRAVGALQGLPSEAIVDPGVPYVLVARDLAPADTAVLDLDRVLAFVTSEGGPTSHSAILARQRGIVAVVGATGVAAVADGTELLVDALHGRVVADPDPAERAEAELRLAVQASALATPAAPGALADGTRIALLANIGSPSEVGDAARLGAEGVGLLRTEFLFLDAAEPPTVDAQLASYRAVLDAFPGMPVVVRLLDAGADKPLAFLPAGEELNPALGRRGLRALRAEEGVLRDQLAALAAAGAGSAAELWVMAPMVTTVEEARFVVQAAHDAGIPNAGVVIEVPSAALIADRMLRHVDFASIGTNDLTQYTLAADRSLGGLSALQDPWHPAVLRLVAEVGAAGIAQGTQVGVCGEAAADPLLAIVFAGLGITSLSMAPAALAGVRAALARCTREQAESIAAAALAAEEADEARRAASAVARARFIG